MTKQTSEMKPLIPILALVLVNCTNSNNPLATQIKSPAVQAQIIGDAEKDLLAGGGALLVSGGNSGAAIAAITAQEVQNIPQLQKALATATPATVSSVPAPSGAVTAPALPVVINSASK